MKRDLITKTRRHTASRASSDSFFFLLEAIARQQTPTKTQLEQIESSYNSTAEFLSNRPEFANLVVQIHPHGSRQLGTMIRPWDDSRDGFDIDLIARLDAQAHWRYSDERGPARLLNQFHTAFQDYANAHGLTLKKWDRCVTLCYSGGMCADIAPVIDNPLLAQAYGPTHGLIPDRNASRFESTNPRGYAKFFSETAAIEALMPAMEAAVFDSMRKAAEVVPLNDPDEVFEPLLCRIVQVLKLHRNVTFLAESGTKDLAPSSIFITTLAAHAYAARAPMMHTTPLELLLDVVEMMPTMFASTALGRGEKWHLPNPAAPKSNLAEDMNDPPRQLAFRAWIERLVDDIERILAAIEARQGIASVIDQVHGAFGQRPSQAVEKALLEQQKADRSRGRSSFLTAAATPMTVPSRSHNFFG
jgi:hypothetical protein